MSDLGAIFHVKKDGVQYDAHAYTTTDECPEPNLKLTYKGQQGYVKLEAKGEGDVPCYVKNKAGVLYQVKKEAIPTGELSFRLEVGYTFTLTIPKGIHVLFVDDLEKTHYIAVTPGTTHRYHIAYHRATRPENGVYLGCKDHLGLRVSIGNRNSDVLKLKWSPEINKVSPSYKDGVE